MANNKKKKINISRPRRKPENHVSNVYWISL